MGKPFFQSSIAEVGQLFVVEALDFLEGEGVGAVVAPRRLHDAMWKAAMA